MDIASYRPLAACLMVKMTGLGPDRFDYPGMFYFYQRTSVNTAENVSEGNLARLVAAGRCRMVTANEVYRNNGHKLCWTPANLAERDYAPLVNVPMGAPALGTAESAYGGLVCVAYGLAPGTSMQFELSTIHEFVPDPSGGFFETAKAPEAPGVKDIYDKVLVTAADMGWTNGPVGPTGGTGGPGPRSAMDRGHDAFDTLLGYAPKTL